MQTKPIARKRKHPVSAVDIVDLILEQGDPAQMIYHLKQMAELYHHQFNGASGNVLKTYAILSGALRRCLLYNERRAD